MFNLQQQKFLKRPADDVDNGAENFEPPHKLPNNNNNNTINGSENLTKFSVEIVQQLEFTTSAANSQPQQISTNVTVKALTNTSVKTEPGTGAGGGGSGGINDQQSNNGRGGMGTNGMPGSNNNNVGAGNSNLMGGGNTNQKNSSAAGGTGMGGLGGNVVECKREPDHDFSDLAGLEKEGGPSGNFPGFPDLMGDDTTEGNETFKDLINELQDFNPGFLDFDEKPLLDIKTEDGIKVEPPNAQDLMNSLNVKSENAMAQFNAAFGGPNAGGASMGGNSGPGVMGLGGPLGPPPGSAPNDQQNGMNKMRQQFQSGPNVGPPMSEMALAAQTLKHMAEQHQHKNAMGNMNFPRPPMHHGSQQAQQGQIMGGPGGPGSRYNDFGPGAGVNYGNEGFMGPNGPQPNQQQQHLPPQFHPKNNGPNAGPNHPQQQQQQQQQSFMDMKQELFYSSQNDFDLKRLQQQAQMHQQQQQQQSHHSQSHPNVSKMGPQQGGPNIPPGFAKPPGSNPTQPQSNSQQPQYSPFNSSLGPNGNPNANGAPNFMQGPGGRPTPGASPNQGGPNSNSNTNSAQGSAGPNMQQQQQQQQQHQQQQQQQQSSTTLQMKQTQQLHISQQGGSHGIQVTNFIKYFKSCLKVMLVLQIYEIIKSN